MFKIISIALLIKYTIERHVLSSSTKLRVDFVHNILLLLYLCGTFLFYGFYDKFDRQFRYNTSSLTDVLHLALMKIVDA